MEHTILDTIEENTLLEDGEQAVVIQTDAIDNLEIGAQAIMIQMDANDNEVEEVYSQELDFVNQPLQQNQQRTEVEELRENFESYKVTEDKRYQHLTDSQDELTRSLNEMSENSKRRIEAVNRTMADNHRAVQENYKFLQENQRALQEQLDAIERDAEKSRRLLKTVSEKVSRGVERRSGVGMSNAEATVKQGVGMVQSQGGVGVRPKTSPVEEEQQYIDPSILRSNLNEDEKLMMSEILNATITPVSKAIGELTGVVKTLVGAAGAPDGDGGDSDDDPRRPKRVPGKDKGKPTSRNKGKHRDNDSGRDSSVQVEVEDVSSLNDHVPIACVHVVGQDIPVPITVTFAVPTVVPTETSALKMLMTGSYSQPRVGLKDRIILGSGGGGGELALCSMMEDDVGLLAVGRDGMESSDDDDYRHRRRGRGDHYADPGGCLDQDVDQVHSVVMTDRLLGIDACSDTDALEVSDRCILDHSTDDRVESWDVSSPVQLPNVDVAFESGVDDRTGWQDVI